MLACVATLIIDRVNKQVLLVKRKDSDKFSPPGGKVEFGEDLTYAACRETFEETDLKIGSGRLEPIHEGHWPLEEMSEGHTTVFLFKGDGIDLRDYVRHKETVAMWFPIEALWDERINAFVLFYRGFRKELEQKLYGRTGVEALIETLRAGDIPGLFDAYGNRSMSDLLENAIRAAELEVPRRKL